MTVSGGSDLPGFLIQTGARRGEALALKWEDVDFDRGRIRIRRSWSKGHLSTPKNGRGVAIPPGLASILLDLLGERRQEALARGWGDVPPWVFCSEKGGLLDERNVQRSWDRVRKRAKVLGVRPLKLHTARHTYATSALQARKSIRWVADQLGHANPAFTMRVYAHALPEEEVDLSFAEFGVAGDGAGRRYTAPNKTRGPSRSVEPREMVGGAEGDRTPDPQTASLMLSQLSYSPTRIRRLPPAFRAVKVWRTGRCEPPRGSVILASFCRSGEIGIRRGLKIPRLHGRAGSTPASGTK
jgi:hypothetical protein